MMTIATAFTQWVTRTQSGWMTAPVGAAGVKACSWVAPIDMAWLVRLSCNRATYSKFARAGGFTFPCRRPHSRFLKHAASELDEQRLAEHGSIGPAEE